MASRVGIDLVAVAEVADAVGAHGERYLRRIYTAAELDDCTMPGGLRAEALASCFAAKEAAIKALGADGTPVPWRSIELRRRASGAVHLKLEGAAASLAARGGIESLAVSVAGDGVHATAVVVADGVAAA